MIQPTDYAVLRAFGLADALLDHDARIERLHGEAGSGGRVVLDVGYAALGERAGFGVGIHRATLFALLHDAVTAESITIETGCPVEASERLPDDRRRLLLEGGRSVGPFDLIVDALGTRTPPAPLAGGRYLMARCGAHSTGRWMRASIRRRLNSAIAEQA